MYQLWEESGAFTPKHEKGKSPFTIIMPPPNANDPLHIGHAREVSTQDILIRYHRMKGDPTLWLPGADHAGIETQYVYEKKLRKEGKSRFDFDRKELYQKIWDYVQDNKQLMEGQLKRLGASCDWTRNKFTLDEDIVDIVYETFKSLYDDGHVYRGERIVNYCPRCGTNFSELEVDHVEQDGQMYYLDYGLLTIATARPETIFADVAVAVNPKDKRYSKLVGKTAVIPLVKREVPIIADKLVEKEYGTGALKVTPGHDATDFEIGQRHKLPTLSVIDKDGKMTGTPSKYVGLKALTARQEVVDDLKKAGKLVKTKKIRHVVSLCYRDKGQIEPLVSKQWFLKVEPLVKPALKAIANKDVRFVAKKYEKIAKHWLKNLKDWNISRQVIWGIQIPAWRCDSCLSWTITKGEAPSECDKCGKSKLSRDSDTFDTWFSSGQWPFATLMTTKPGDFDYFYPTSVMDPSYDILPFWVIRMLMLGLYRTNKVPFRDVLLHGLVRDKHGVKISKSKGNVVDPIEMIDKYGSDALRVALVWGSLVENDNSLSEENIKAQRNFANKVWNVARFISQDTLQQKSRQPSAKHKDDKEIAEELKAVIKKTTASLDKYRLNEAAEGLYDFVWNVFANEYLEKTKDRREDALPMLTYVLQETLKLLHPFMPFVSEAVWQNCFSNGKKDLLITASWPGK